MVDFKQHPFISSSSSLMYFMLYEILLKRLHSLRTYILTNSEFDSGTIIINASPLWTKSYNHIFEYTMTSPFTAFCIIFFLNV